MKSKHETTKTNWSFKRKELSSRKKNNIIGAVLKVGARTLFKNHVYKYGDNIYHQIRSRGAQWTSGYGKSI